MEKENKIETATLDISHIPLKEKPIVLQAKMLFVALGIGVLCAIIIQLFCGFSQDAQVIRDNMLRLHILANSNSEEDQTLKLAVRNRILAESEELFFESENVESAQRQVAQNIERVIAIAQDEVKSQGYDYPVNAEVCNMYFDTREYEQFELPAGRYDALRITIGDAKGKNWWCVLYPPMCLPAAMPQEVLSESELNAKQQDIVGHSEKYKFEFAVVEWWEGLIEKLR